MCYPTFFCTQLLFLFPRPSPQSCCSITSKKMLLLCNSFVRHDCYTVFFDSPPVIHFVFPHLAVITGDFVRHGASQIPTPCFHKEDNNGHKWLWMAGFGGTQPCSRSSGLWEIRMPHSTLLKTICFTEDFDFFLFGPTLCASVEQWDHPVMFSLPTGFWCSFWSWIAVSFPVDGRYSSWLEWSCAHRTESLGILSENHLTPSWHRSTHLPSFDINYNEWV